MIDNSLTIKHGDTVSESVSGTMLPDMQIETLHSNGRKKKLQREDFITSAATLGIENLVVERLINKYIKLLLKFEAVIQTASLSVELKEKYGELLKERLAGLA